jgi:hypothetical protein
LLFFAVLSVFVELLFSKEKRRSICAAKKSNFEQNPERISDAKFLEFNGRTRGKRRSRRKSETFDAASKKANEPTSGDSPTLKIEVNKND